MTWRTQLGERNVIGPEAALIRSAIAFMHDLIEAEIADRDDSWDYGVPVFDNLEPASKLSLLADVGESLLSETPPPRAAVFNRRQQTTIPPDESAIRHAFG